MSLSELLTVDHLSWATWSIHSQSLFWHERPGRFAHSRSFVLSDLSESLTVTHLIWAIWANEQIPKPAKNEWCEQITQVAHQKWATMSDLLRLLTKNEQMSEFPTLFQMEQSPLKIVIPVGTAIIKVAKVK